MSNKNKPTVRLKKLMANTVLLSVFILPMIVSLIWIYGVITGGDPRRVYSQDYLSELRTATCQDNGSEVRPFDEPLITITFDDGWESIYSQGLPVLEQMCIRSTQYILGDHFKEINYMSENQVESMQLAGHEIASHTMNHPNLTKLGDEELDMELGESDRLLSKKFGEMRDFASPLGASNDKVLKNIKKYYRSHRNTVADPATVGDEDINVRETFDFYQINAYTVRQDTTLDDIKKLIEYTKQRNGWLILTYHQIDDSDAYYAVSKSGLEQQLRLVLDSGLKTPVTGEVLDKLEAGSRR